jgi:glycosyltransferase involved in cell wall biosynthesis
MINKSIVSIIIATYNREDCLIKAMQSLLVQNYKYFELIIIDQSDIISEEKKQLIKKHPQQIRFFHIKERGRSLAKNYGILQAKGDLILFCDDDILVEPNFLETHVAIYSKDSQIGAASCRLVEEGDPELPIATPLKNTFYGKLINKPYSTSSGYVTSLNGGNMSFKKNVLNKVGFFEEYFEGTSMVEEPDIAYRVTKNNYKIYFDASVTVKHFPQYNGNVAYMKSKRAEWFYFYFYNLLMFFTKYNRFINLPIVFAYTILVCTKHIFLHKMPLSSYSRMLSGFFNGAKKGFKLYSFNKDNVYFSPYRFPKQTIHELNCND